MKQIPDQSFSGQPSLYSIRSKLPKEIKEIALYLLSKYEINKMIKEANLIAENFIVSGIIPLHR